MSSCEHSRNLMMRRLDDLAGPEEIEELDSHLSGCEHCRYEWLDFRSAKDATDRIRNSLAFDSVLDEIQAGILARLTQRLAAGLLVAGLLVLGLFGLLEIMIADDVPLAVRTGIALTGAGTLLFLWETLRWKLRTHAADPYRHVIR